MFMYCKIDDYEPFFPLRNERKTFFSHFETLLTTFFPTKTKRQACMPKFHVEVYLILLLSLCKQVIVVYGIGKRRRSRSGSQPAPPVRRTPSSCTGLVENLRNQQQETSKQRVELCRVQLVSGSISQNCYHGNRVIGVPELSTGGSTISGQN